jgi:type IV pilus assembly protein PilM
LGSSKNGAAARAKRIAAFEIGAGIVSATEVEVRGGHARVLKHGSAPAPRGIWDNLAGGREGLAQAIRSAAASGGIRCARAIVAVPRRYVTVKYARLPQGSADQVAGMVRYEAQQYVPFPIDEVVFDHQIVSDAGDDMTTVMVVAARRSLVNDLLAAFDRAGIEISSVSVTSLALAEHIRGEAMPVAVLSVEDDRLDVAVAAAGRVLFSREADMGDVTDGGSDPDVLVGEVMRSLSAYQNEHRSRPVERVVLASQRGADSDLRDRLAAALQVAVQDLPEAQAIGVGLALQQSTGAMSTVNLLPAQRIERRAEARRRALTRLTAVVVCALLAVGAWAIQQGMAAQARERKLATVENRRLRALQAALKTTQAQRERVVRMHEAVARGLGRDRPVVDVLKAVSDALPADGGVFLTQLTFDRNGPVVIHGSARGHQAATAFLAGLQDSGAFDEARLGYLGDTKSVAGPQGVAPAPTEAPSENTSFMISCRLPQAPGDDGAPATRGGARTARGAMAADAGAEKEAAQ